MNVKVYKTHFRAVQFGNFTLKINEARALLKSVEIL